MIDLLDKEALVRARLNYLGFDLRREPNSLDLFELSIWSRQPSSGTRRLQLHLEAMAADLDPETQLALFKATIAAYVLKDLNPDQKPERTRQVAKATLLVFSHLRWKDYFRRRIDNERETVRVLGATGKPIALCIVSLANLDMLVVAPSERGKGVGEQLLADAEARMRESGINEAHLYVAIKNDGAIRFYARHGWTDAGEVDKVFQVAGGTMTNTVRKMVKAF